MDRMVYSEDIVETIKNFYMANEGDDDTQYMLIAIGAELLNVEHNDMIDLMESN